MEFVLRVVDPADRSGIVLFILGTRVRRRTRPCTGVWRRPRGQGWLAAATAYPPDFPNALRQPSGGVRLCCVEIPSAHENSRRCECLQLRAPGFSRKVPGFSGKRCDLCRSGQLQPAERTIARAGTGALHTARDKPKKLAREWRDVLHPPLWSARDGPRRASARRRVRLTWGSAPAPLRTRKARRETTCRHASIGRRKTRDANT